MTCRFIDSEKSTGTDRRTARVALTTTAPRGSRWGRTTTSTRRNPPATPSAPAPNTRPGAPDHRDRGGPGTVPHRPAPPPHSP
ncbi:hypothetical protein DDJ31_06200 [Streptomyces griseoviridis]|uniref:Uncharacterized protein n=1 Tax=Streptomyces griseoviridis TaxID=45398 RepID=A0ABX5TRA0_STRGD|nr:hypothetical protein DDJ31_06200 [Streptomyces griseoviridis]